MKLTIQHRYVRSSDEIDSLVEERLCTLAERRRIDEAVVRLEDRHEASPRFRAFAHLRTPGPDLVAEAMDHSLEAAVRKLDGELNALLDGRERRRNERGRSKRSGAAIKRKAPPVRR